MLVKIFLAQGRDASFTVSQSTKTEQNVHVSIPQSLTQCSLLGGESQDPDLALVDSKIMHFKLHVVIQSLSHV